MLLGNNVINNKRTLKFPVPKPCDVNIDANYLKINILCKLSYGSSKPQQVHVNNTIAETETEAKTAHIIIINYWR